MRRAPRQGSTSEPQLRAQAKGERLLPKTDRAGLGGRVSRDLIVDRRLHLARGLPVKDIEQLDPHEDVAAADRERSLDAEVERCSWVGSCREPRDSMKTCCPLVPANSSG